MQPLQFNHAKLRTQREKLGLSREDLVVALAQLGLRVSTASIVRWEEGRHAPSAPQLPKLCSALQLRVTDFYDGATSKEILPRGSRRRMHEEEDDA